MPLSSRSPSPRAEVSIEKAALLRRPLLASMGDAAAGPRDLVPRRSWLGCGAVTVLTALLLLCFMGLHSAKADGGAAGLPWAAVLSPLLAIPLLALAALAARALSPKGRSRSADERAAHPSRQERETAALRVRRSGAAPLAVHTRPRDLQKLLRPLRQVFWPRSLHWRLRPVCSSVCSCARAPPPPRSRRLAALPRLRRRTRRRWPLAARDRSQSC